MFCPQSLEPRSTLRRMSIIRPVLTTLFVISVFMYPTPHTAAAVPAPVSYGIICLTTRDASILAYEKMEGSAGVSSIMWLAYHSNDGGLTWQSDNAATQAARSTDPCPARAPQSVWLLRDTHDANALYLVVAGQGVFASSDGGTSFKLEQTLGVDAIHDVVWNQAAHTLVLLVGESLGVQVRAPDGKWLSVTVSGNRDFFREPQPPLVELNPARAGNSNGSMARANVARTGSYDAENMQPAGPLLGGAAWTFQAQHGLEQSPAVTDGSVYLASFEALYALDARTGKTKWRFPLNTLSSAPAVANGLVYLSVLRQPFHAIDAQTGQVRWTYEGDGGVSGAPIIYQGSVYLGDWNDLIALDAKTGALKWRLATLASVSSPAANDNTIYISADAIYALDSDSGVLKWKFTPAARAGAPVVADGLVVFAADGLYTLDAMTGVLKWKRDIPGNSQVPLTPAVADSTVYYSNGKLVYAFGVRNGEPRWQFEAEGELTTSAAVAGGLVYVADAEWNVYSLDAATGTVKSKFTTSDAVKTAPAISGDLVYFGDDAGMFYAVGEQAAASNSAAQLLARLTQENGLVRAPLALATDSHDNLYVTHGSGVQKFDSDGKLLASWGTRGTGAGQFNSPAAIALDSQGNLYIADTDNSRVQVLDPSGKFLSQWGKSGSGDSALDHPYGIAVDAQGNVYVADSRNARVQKFDRNGKFLLRWSAPDGTNGKFDPMGIAVEPQANIVVADGRNGRLMRFDPNGVILTTIAEGNLAGVWAVAVDAQGNLYALDWSARRVLVYDASGKRIADWGGKGKGDGQFVSPQGIAIDTQGHIYVADKDGDNIQKFALP